MRIPKEKTCVWCGRRILFAAGPDGRKLVLDSRLTPYRRVTERERGPYLYDKNGNRLPAEPLPYEREAEAEGYGHTAHFCSGPPRRPRPLTKKEKWAMAREEL